MILIKCFIKKKRTWLSLAKHGNLKAGDKVETYNKKGFKVGDWVIGKSYNGELVQGYIEIMEPLNTIVKVFVIESDNVRFKGRVIKLNEKTIEKQPIFSDYVEGELLNLIDLALATKDKPWFLDLTAKLLKKQNRLMIKEDGLRKWIHSTC